LTLLCTFHNSKPDCFRNADDLKFSMTSFDITNSTGHLAQRLTALTILLDAFLSLIQTFFFNAYPDLL